MRAWTRTHLLAWHASTLSFLGWILNDAGDWRSADRHYVLSMQAATEAEDAATAARTMHLAGRGAMEWSSVREGLARLQCADATAERASSPRLQAAIVSDMGIAYAKTGAAGETRECVARSTDLAAQDDERGWYAASDIASANATARGELGGKDADEAIAELLSALPEGLWRIRSRALRLVTLGRITRDPNQKTEWLREAKFLAKDVRSVRLDRRLAALAG
jgi:hypothetical protein